MKGAVIGLVGLLASLPLLSAEPAGSYFCIADQSTGFAIDPDSSEWEVAEFESARFIVRRRSTENLEGLKDKLPTLNWDLLNSIDWVWEVALLGDLAIAYCKNDITETGYLDCEGLNTKFVMNTTRGRFIIVDFGGYADSIENLNFLGIEEGEHKPFMMIGKCSQI